MLTSRASDGTFATDGGKVRLKYIAPHDDTAGAFWGVNFEVGRTSRMVSETPCNAQLKGIVGWRGNGWTLGANPKLTWSVSPGGEPIGFSLDLKAARAVSDTTQLGVELYNELGPVRHLSAFNRNGKMFFLTIDQDLGHEIDLNLGLGRGLTNDSDRWVLKFIVGTHF